MLLRVCAFLAAGTLAQPVAAQDHSAGIGAAFDMFESRCILALTDPAGYVALLASDAPGSRTAANTPDGTVLVVLPRDMEAAENVSISATPHVQHRSCNTGYYGGGEDQGPAIDAAFRALVAARGDLAITGGAITLPGDPAAGDSPWAGLRFYRYMVTGLDVPDDVVVGVNIESWSFEIFADRSVPHDGE